MPLSKRPAIRKAQVEGRMSMIRNIEKRVKQVESNVRAQETKKHNYMYF